MPFETTYPAVASLVSVLLGLLTISIVLRFVARFKQKATIGPDDYLLIVSWLSFVGLTTLASYGMAHGFVGFPTPEDPAAVVAIFPLMMEIYFILDNVAIIGIGCVRLSCLFFYRRIFYTGRHNAFDVLTIVMIVIVSLWMLVFVIRAFQCGSNVVQVTTPSPTCANHPWLIGTGISSFILDFIILVLPLSEVSSYNDVAIGDADYFLIWRLHASPAKRLSICGVFLLGTAGAGASCTRMVIFINLWHVSDRANKLNFYESNTSSLYFTCLEVGLSAIAVSLPSLWYFRQGVWPCKLLQKMRGLASLRSSQLLKSDAETTVPTTLPNDYISASGVPAIPTRRDVFEKQKSAGGSESSSASQ